MNYALLAGVLLMLVFGCTSVPTTPDENTTTPQPGMWLEIRPLQCGTNTWEIWHEGLNRTYVRAPTEQEVVTEYLQTQGVRVIGYQSIPAPAGTAVCEACSCNRGDTIRVQVASEQEKARMIPLGWRPAQ